MNENIERLSKEAMEYAAEQYGPQRQGEKVWNPHTYDQKFAELIVQECVNVLHDNELWNRHISHALNEHFGVEHVV